MSEPEILLDYSGPLDFNVIDSLLKKLKKTKEYTSLNMTTRKRVYSMVVECLENICKHSELKVSGNPELYSHISVRNENDRVIIKSGNPVKNEEKENLAGRIDHINCSDETTLKVLYENKIKSDLKAHDKCAGLGLIFMALKSGNKLVYSFSPSIYGLSFFEIQITLNK